MDFYGNFKVIFICIFLLRRVLYIDIVKCLNFIVKIFVFFFINFSLCLIILIDFIVDLMVNLISKLMYENLKYIYFVIIEFWKKILEF